MIHLSDVPVLETERLTLRVPTGADAAAYMQFYQSDRSAYVGGPVDMRGGWDKFASVLGHWLIHGYGMFAVTLRGTTDAIGLVGHWFPPNWPETEVGWVLFDAAHEGQGYAGEAAKAAISYGWDVLNWSSMVSYVHFDNERSSALALKLGAKLDPDAAHPGKPCLVYRHERGPR
jgi:RimJ/RimL family protein N-acetyltransferase